MAGPSIVYMQGSSILEKCNVGWVSHLNRVPFKGVKEGSMRREVIALFMLLLCVGCKSESYVYKYISLRDGDGIEVMRYGESELANLEYDAEMPILYELNRKNYILVFKVDDVNYWPALYVSVRSLSDDSYSKIGRANV